MARVFVSSRMAELYWERRKVVELLHYAGHTPLFFEREPWTENPEEAKRSMDTMLGGCDGLVQIHFLTCGVQQAVLDDQTPVWYEFKEFASSVGGPCVLLIKPPPGRANPEPSLSELRERILRYPRSSQVTMGERLDWTSSFLDAVQGTGLRCDCSTRRDEVVVRYSGRDLLGLLEAVTRVLFRTFQLNIDYLNYSAVGGWGTLCAVCSACDAANDGERLCGEVEAALSRSLGTLSEGGRGSRGSLMEASEGIGVPGFSVREYAGALKERQSFSFEVHHADLPGQLHAICTILRDLQLNVDEARVHQMTERGLPRTSVARFYVSETRPAIRDRLAASTSQSRAQDLILQAEEHLRQLIGVRSVIGRVVSRGIGHQEGSDGGSAQPAQ